MANSAITFNTTGLASTTSPGLVGTGAQTFAGKKTLDGGALIKGDNGSAAIAASYVGELKSTRNAANINVTAQTYVNYFSLSLGSGIWLVSGFINILKNTSAFTSIDIDVGYSGTNDSAAPQFCAAYQIATVSTSFSRLPVCLPSVQVRCDGTNLFRDDGTSYTGTTIYLKAYIGAITSGTAQILANSYLTATRIA